MSALTRTATCRALQSRDLATDEPVSPAQLAERVSWAAELVAEVAQSTLDAHWDGDAVHAISGAKLPSGRRTPKFGYKAAAALWGWTALPAGIYASSRIVWMAMELAARQLRSAQYRADAVFHVLRGNDDLVGDPVTARNTRRQVGRYLDSHRALPVNLFALEPDAPRAPQQLVLAASDSQYSSCDTLPLYQMARCTLLLPLCPRPARRAEWTQVEVLYRVPPRYLEGDLRPPALRVQDDLVRIDLPVAWEGPRLLPDSGICLSGDWGTNRLMTACIVRRSTELDGLPWVDGRPLLFDPSKLCSKSLRLTKEREALRKKLDHLSKLHEGRATQALADQMEDLQASSHHLNQKQQHLHDQLAGLCASWMVHQALAAGASMIALEDLKTLEHRGLGKKNNARVSMALRGQVYRAVEEAAALWGIQVIPVNARGTSSYCSRCDAKVRHLKYPGGPTGHNWMSCPQCGHQGPRDLPAAEKVGQRALAPKTKKVRRRATPKKLLVPSPKPSREKAGPTPTRRRRPPSPSAPAGAAARQHLHGAATSPNRSAGPETQGSTPQSWSERSAQAALRAARLSYASRHSIRISPVRYRADAGGVLQA